MRLKIKSRHIFILAGIALFPSYLLSGSICLKSKNVKVVSCNEVRPVKAASESINAIYSFYRFVNKHKIRRTCNFSPSCSLFAKRVIKRDGAIGFLKSLARSQMEHSNQNGFLNSFPSADGIILVKDSINSW